MLTLSPDLKSKCIAIAEPNEAFYNLKLFGYPIGINRATETIQRLKMIYMQNATDYDGFIANYQNVDYPP